MISNQLHVFSPTRRRPTGSRRRFVSSQHNGLFVPGRYELVCINCGRNECSLRDERGFRVSAKTVETGGGIQTFAASMAPTYTVDRCARCGGHMLVESAKDGRGDITGQLNECLTPESEDAALEAMFGSAL